jgi:hypothetical protein
MKRTPSQGAHRTLPRWLLFLLGLMVSASPAAWGLNHTISGLYVAKQGAMILALHLVETEDRHVTGRYEEISVKDAHLQRQDASVSGAVSGSNFEGEIRLIVGMPFSAVVHGDDLTVSSSSLNATFHKTDQAGYDQAVAQLTTMANTAAHEHMREQQLKADQVATLDLERYASNLEQAAATAKNYARHAPEVESQYASTTRVLEQLRAKQEEVPATTGQAQVARTQIFLQMQQAEMSAQQLHYRIVRARDGLASTVHLAKPRIDAYRQHCQATPAYVQSPSLQPRWKKDCARLNAAATDFEASAQDATEAFAQLNRSWTQQRQEQERLLQEGQNK